jgi:glycerophosphoryl diester phosphodiesterase
MRLTLNWSKLDFRPVPPASATGNPMTKPFEIIAHRGSSYLAPENTLAAVQLGWREGADAVEGDFRLTADGQIVCIHDESLKRTAGFDRRVAEMRLQEIETLDVGSWKNTTFAGERVPTLEQLLASIPDKKRFFVEIKCGAEIVPAFQRVAANSRLQPSQIVPISLKLDVCRAIKRALPVLDVYWVVEFRRDVPGLWRPTLDEILREIDAPIGPRLDGLDVMAGGPIDAAFVERARNSGLRLCCWTVDDPAQAERLIELGIPGITTNRPGWLREQLASGP